VGTPLSKEKKPFCASVSIQLVSPASGDSAEVAIACYWEASPTVNVVPFRRPSAHPALEGLSIRELRQVVRDRGLRIVGYGSLPKAKLIEAIRAA
jgi:hypothetical protein